MKRFKTTYDKLVLFSKTEVKTQINVLKNNLALSDTLKNSTNTCFAVGLQNINFNKNMFSYVNYKTENKERCIQQVGSCCHLNIDHILSLQICNQITYLINNDL